MKKILPQIRGKYRFDVEIGKTCWFATGGKASVVFIPSDLEDLIFFLKNKDRTIPIFVFGVGSNLLIRDGGFDGWLIGVWKLLLVIFQSVGHQRGIRSTA